jgi:hypothetical protein
MSARGSCREWAPASRSRLPYLSSRITAPKHNSEPATAPVIIETLPVLSILLDPTVGAIVGDREDFLAGGVGVGAGTTTVVGTAPFGAIVGERMGGEVMGETAVGGWLALPNGMLDGRFSL